MSKIYNSAAELIGSTPLVALSRFAPGCNIIAKLEFQNPGGSVKDRVALAMIEDAEEKGLLKPGSTIIEPTSGNTGIGLACAAATRGYKTLIVMPDSMSPERIKIMEGYGAQVVLTPGAEGMSGAIAKAKHLQQENPGSFIPGQFENPANPQAHYRTTGPEIWKDTDGAVDYFVAGVGTGGTITGTGRYLKEQNSAIKVVAVEPAASQLLSGGTAAPHGLQGIGANFIPDVLDQSIIDEIIPVTEEQAYEAARRLGKTEGLLVGISAGAALHAACQVAQKNPKATVVVLLPDTGERYLSSPLFK